MKALFTLTFLMMTISGFATDYYISAKGNDSNPGTSPDAPWKTLNKVQQMAAQLQPGDQILFKKGDTFTGSLKLSQLHGSDNQPIVIGAYGTGNAPVIQGALAVNDWKKDKGNIWKASIKSNGLTPNAVVYDNSLINKSRYPNISDDNGGYLTEDKGHGFHDKQVIIDNDLSGKFSKNHWQGAEVVTRTREWLLDVATVKSQDGNTIQLANKITYGIPKGFGYFFQNSYDALDVDKEWYYDASTQTMYLYLKSDDPNEHQIEIPQSPTVFSLSNSDQVIIKDITFQKSRESTVYMIDVEAVTFTNNQILLSAQNGLDIMGGEQLTLASNEIDHSQNNGLDLQANNSIIEGNTIKNTGQYAGMGVTGNHQYIACYMTGEGNKFVNNTVSHTGYNAIHFNRGPWLIENNMIDHFNMVKNDGAGIYSYKNDAKNQILNNIILYSGGSEHGIPDPLSPKDRGIYADEGTKNTVYQGNTIAYCGEGMIVHASSYLDIIDNNFYDNRTYALRISQRGGVEKQEFEIEKLKIEGNTFYSSQEDYPLVQMWVENKKVSEAEILQNNKMIKATNTASPQTAQSYIASQTGSATNAPMSTNARQSMSKGEIAMAKNRYDISKKVGSEMIQNGQMDEPYGPGSWTRDPSKSSNFKMAIDGSAIDGRTLRIFFSSKSPDKVGKAVQKKLSLKKGAYYAVTFETKGNSGTPFTFQISTGSKGQEIHTVNYLTATAEPTEHEIVFEAKSDTDMGRMIFEIYEDTQELFIDNVSMYQVEVNETDTEVLSKLEYNATSKPKIVKVGSEYLTADGSPVSGSVKIPPYSSILLLKKAE